MSYRITRTVTLACDGLLCSNATSPAFVEGQGPLAVDRAVGDLVAEEGWLMRPHALHFCSQECADTRPAP